MKRYKKVVLILVCLALLMLSACAKRETVTVLREWDAPDGASDAANGGAQDVLIGMVTDVGGINDASFNQSAWEGLQELSSATGCTVDYIDSEQTGDFATNFETLAENGYQLIWGIGYSCADAMVAVAEKYPDVHFAVIDNAFEDTPSNVTGVTFHAEQPSFLVGYIAASVSETGKIGFVGGISSELIDAFQYGYQAGAAYADRENGKTTEVSVSYAGSWGEPEIGQKLANEMYNQGCDIIYHAAGGTGVGVINAAKLRDKYAIGVDRDQAYLAPKNVLTSGLKKVNAAIFQVSRDFIEGREIGGQTFSFGLAEGAVGIPDDHSNYSDAVYDAALRTADDIIAGKITVPATKAEFDKFISK